MWVHNLNPVILNLGLIQIRWYGLMYIIGVLFTYWFINWYTKKKKIKITKEQISDLIFWLVVGLLVGGRLGYVIFYNPALLLKPLEAIAFWKGGMSFHGGFSLAVLFGYFYCRKHKLKFLRIADIVVIPLPIALMFGRIGNFINGELWGKPWKFGWAFPLAPDRGTIARYPSQLFEALKNFLIFGSLFWISSFKKRKDGELFFLFLLLYGLFRFLVEFIREPELILLGITMGQWLSIPMIFIGGIILIKRWTKS